MKGRIFIPLMLLAALLPAGCRRAAQAPAAPQLRPFPYPEIPALYTDPAEQEAWFLLG